MQSIFGVVVVLVVDRLERDLVVDGVLLRRLAVRFAASRIEFEGFQVGTLCSSTVGGAGRRVRRSKRRDDCLEQCLQRMRGRTRFDGIMFMNRVRSTTVGYRVHVNQRHVLAAFMDDRLRTELSA